MIDTIKYAGDMYRCADDDHSLRLAQRYTLDHTTKEQSFWSTESPAPRLNHGRWLVDCACGSAAGISRAGTAYCFNCGAIMKVTLPPQQDRDTVEALLMQRKPADRNWHPDREPVNTLAEEVTP